MIPTVEARMEGSTPFASHHPKVSSCAPGGVLPARRAVAALGVVAVPVYVPCEGRQRDELAERQVIELGVVLLGHASTLPDRASPLRTSCDSADGAHVRQMRMFGECPFGVRRDSPEVTNGSRLSGAPAMLELVIEPPVDFERMRRMRCGTCGHEWFVNEQWLDRFNQGLEPCPECGTDCRGEDRPDFCARPDDPSHNNTAVLASYWYHSSTHENWPERDFDPAGKFTEDTRRRMESMAGPGSVERWAARQKDKALHIGTYEAAIENMFRRADDQSGSNEQFFLHRVKLRPDSVIQAGVHKEPTNFVGDAYLAEVCGQGVNVYRYVNVHEDPSGVSLAVNATAIHAVQSIPIPLPVDGAHPWIVDATARLSDACSMPPVQPRGILRKIGVKPTSALASEARELEKEVASSLPFTSRTRLDAGFDEAAFAASPTAFPAKLLGLTRLVSDFQAVLDALDSQPWRVV